MLMHFLNFSALLADQSVTMSEDEASGLVALIIGLGLTAIVFAIFHYVLLAIANWKMFTKCDEAGWKAWIPVYRLYVSFKLAWEKGSTMFWVYFGTTVAYVIVNSLSSGQEGGAIIFVIIMLALLVAQLVVYIMFLMRQAHSYNKGTGCGILALFFPHIMALYYGFAETCVYQGPQE